MSYSRSFWRNATSHDQLDVGRIMNDTTSSTSPWRSCNRKYQQHLTPRIQQVSLGSMTWLDLTRTDHKCEAGKIKTWCIRHLSSSQVCSLAPLAMRIQGYKNTSEEKRLTLVTSQNFPPKLKSRQCLFAKQNFPPKTRWRACLPNRTELFRTVSNPNCEESGHFGAIKVPLTKKWNCPIGCVTPPTVRHSCESLVWVFLYSRD
jgi:hypothetical protein